MSCDPDGSKLLNLPYELLSSNGIGIQFHCQTALCIVYNVMGHCSACSIYYHVLGIDYSSLRVVIPLQVFCISPRCAEFDMVIFTDLANRLMLLLQK